MKKPVLAAISVMLLVSACGAVQESRFNPFNWFGGSQSVPMVAAAGPVASEEARLLVDQVVTLAVEPMLGGAIVRATGLPPTQGWWEGELVARDLDDNGVQVFDFRLLPPIIDSRASTPKSREVTVAAFLSDTQLAKITEIVVQGEGNARSSRR